MQNQLPERFEFLDFDRFNVHIKGNKLSHEQIKAATHAAQSEKTDNTTYMLLNKQLGIYYAFYKRNLTEAHKCLQIWQTNIQDKDSAEYAEACSYLGYALAIDEKYNDCSLLDMSLEIYDNLRSSGGDNAQQYARSYAFSLVFSAITIQRQALEIRQTNPTASKHLLELARNSLLSAYAKLQENGAHEIDLAEATHALAKLEYYEKNFANAAEYIAVSLQHWQNIHAHSGRMHPMQFNSEYTQAQVLMHLQNYSQAANITQKSIARQQEFFTSNKHIKVAESLLLLADIFEKNQQNIEALQALQRALKIKQELFVDPLEISFIEKKISRITHVVSLGAMQEKTELPIINASFQLDFNNAESHANARARFDEIQHSIAKFQVIFNDLATDQQYALSQLKHKFATLYLHVIYDNFDPERLDKAIAYLNDAKDVIEGPEYFWVLNQLACAYQQKLARKDFTMLEKLYSVNMEVILHNDLPQATKEQKLLVAFAYCTAAQGMAACEKLDIAIHNFEKAINIYHSIGEYQSTQCLRARNVYASYLAKNAQIDFAALTYAAIDSDWRDQENWEYNTFAGRFYVGYARFLRDSMGNLASSLTQMQRAQNILKEANNISYANKLEAEIQDLRKNRAQAPVKVSTGPSTFNYSPDGQVFQTSTLSDSLNI